MIYVIDNGESYSDHCVYFVESDMSPKQVDEMLALGDRGMSIIFITDVLEWRRPAERCTFFSGCYIGSEAYDYAILHESTERLEAQAAIEVEERKKSPTRRMFATDELERRRLLLSA